MRSALAVLLALQGCTPDDPPGTDGSPPAGELADPGTKPIHRLNDTEYRNTLRDLLLTDDVIGIELPSDPVAHGFDNVAELLSVSPLLVELYEAAVDEVLEDLFEIEAEVTEDHLLQAEGPGTYGTGGALAGDDLYALSAVGSLSAPFSLEHDGTYAFTVRAWGRQAGDETVRMRVLIDQVEIATLEVDAGDPGVDFTVEHVVGAGVTTLSVELDNPLETGERALVVDRLVATGPLDPEVGRSEGHKAYVGPCEYGGCVDDVLDEFGTKAWRRPLTDDERAWIREVFDEAQSLGLSPDESFEQAFKAVLLSPDFVFRIEADPVGGEPRALDGYELASRLSYFLWSSMPDDELFAAAADGSLLDEQVLRDQVARMIRDERARALVESFAAQWLEAREIDRIAPNAEDYPDFDDPLRRAMKEEVLRLAEEPLLLGAPLDQLYTGDQTWIDSRLAAHYDLPFDPLGDTWQVVPLPEDRRGVVTSAGWLAVQSHPDRPSVVHRGKWVLENLLCGVVPPPPPNVEGSVVIEPDNGSVREQEEAARMTEGSTCVTCHAQMDPYGHALGGFDGIGAARDTDELGFPIETTVTLPSGETVSSIVDALDVLVSDPRFASCVAEKTLRYALGRDLRIADGPYLDEFTTALVESGLLFEAVVTEIVLSEPFRMKGAPEETP